MGSGEWIPVEEGAICFYGQQGLFSLLFHGGGTPGFAALEVLADNK
jgi:hypothetical protein